MSDVALRLVGKDSMDRKKALEAALGQIERAFGKGSVMKLGTDQVIEVEGISTGSIGLDIALGIGGLPKGRIVEIFGPESSGKTTLALHTAAEAQRLGGTAAFVDAEHALDPSYARKLGVDVEELLISQQDTGERDDGVTSAEREELRRLRRENKVLRQERDILSKAAAWFAQGEIGSPRSSGS